MWSNVRCRAFCAFASGRARGLLPAAAASWRLGVPCEQRQRQHRVSGGAALDEASDAEDGGGQALQLHRFGRWRKQLCQLQKKAKAVQSKRRPARKHSRLQAQATMADAEPSQKRIKRTEEEASESDEGSDTEEDELTLVAGARRGKHEEEDEEDEDEDGDEDGDIVNVDFGLFDPQEIDFLSLKRFLKGLLPGNDDKFAVGASALSEAIIQQPQVGTMVKVGDDVDVWAFATMLPWGPLDESPYRKEIARFLLAKCPDLAATSSDIEGKTVKAQLERFLDGSAGPASILLSERMVNFPPELAPAIFESLLEDVNWARDQRRAAAQSGSTPAGADPQWVLCLAPCYVDDRTEQGEPPPRNPAPKRSPQPCPRPPLPPRPAAAPSTRRCPLDPPQSTTFTSRTSCCTPPRCFRSTSAAPLRRRLLPPRQLLLAALLPRPRVMPRTATTTPACPPRPTPCSSFGAYSCFRPRRFALL